MKVLIFDTETTGLRLHSKLDDFFPENQPRMIEFAGIVVNENAEIVNQFESLVNPERVISDEITQITGVTQEQIESAPTALEVKQNIFDLLTQSDWAVAHNLPFDLAILNSEFRNYEPNFSTDVFPNRRFCTSQYTANAYGVRLRMQDLYQRLTGEPLKQSHRAMDDVLALFDIVKQMDLLGSFKCLKQ